MLTSEAIMSSMKSQVRTIEGRAYVFNADGSTAYTLRSNDYLKGYTVERIGAENKFFGYGIVTRANVKIRDKSRALVINTTMRIRPFIVDRSNGAGTSAFIYPHFDITEVNRDENTNELSVTCYDRLHEATKHTFSELNLTTPYTIQNVVSAIASSLGLASVLSVNVADGSFSINYPEGANFEGTETFREVLDAAAEATQTIYYVDRNNRLTFKRLDISGAAVLDITKDDYFTLDSKTNKRLGIITHATELGDNLTVSTTETGSTQIIRDNPFWELRNDLSTLLDNALIAAGGLTINQFECEWRGNILLEYGDKIALTTKDNGIVYSYLLNDTVTYDGTLKERTSWSYESDDEETAANPTNLGEALKQTYARVDKANKQIEIVASEASANSEAIAAIRIDTDSITQTVTETKNELDSTISEVNEDIAELNTKIEQTAEDINITINNKIGEIDSITTSTGYKFGAEGLEITKSGAPTSTLINEDGMSVSRDGAEVLTANNTGVNAENLHATTYLIIGNNSRFEDFGDRTACFWIG